MLQGKLFLKISLVSPIISFDFVSKRVIAKMLDHTETDIVAYVGGFLLERTPSNGLNVCYYETVNVDLSVWKISNPLLNNVPYFAVQLSITIFMIHLLFFIFNFTRQPRFFAELIVSMIHFAVLIKYLVVCLEGFQHFCYLGCSVTF